MDMKKQIRMYTVMASLFALAACAKGESDGDSSGARTPVTIENQTLYEKGYENCDVRVTGSSSLYLSGSVTSVLAGSTVTLEGDDAWLFLPNVSRVKWNLEKLGKNIFIDGAPLADGVNADVINYYNGVYVKPKAADDYVPATLYMSDDTPADTRLDRIYTGSEIPVGDNRLYRFTLRRGHMMVVAENEDGTGKSKVYMAVDNDLEQILDTDLQGKISFLRIVPWAYVCKRGIGGDFEMKEAVGITWFYMWGIGSSASPQMDYAPMFWGSSASSEANVQKVVADKLVNHILAFNEPDGADQANMTPKAAVERYPLLLKTGLRVGSPACTEGTWKTWLAEFMAGCQERGYRVDFIATHWYDWGNWIPNQNTDPTDAQIDQMVTRFKKDIDDCYAKYGLPIWITEFNANRYRSTDAQVRFLQKAIPMLEANPHVERYAYFQPFGGNGDFLKNGQLTSVAMAYNSAPSTPAVTGSAD